MFEFSKPNDTKPTLIQTIAASKDYLFVTSSKFMSVSYAVNDASIVDLYSQLFLKKVFTF